MNGQLRDLPTLRYITGTVQVPLVLLVWGALVLFFGHQYQANALLPSSDRFVDRVPVEAAELLRAQQRDERLLAQLAAQSPAQVPNLMDAHRFSLDLAAELAGSDLGRGEWQPGSTAVVDVSQAVERTAQQATQQTTHKPTQQTTTSQTASADVVSTGSLQKQPVATRPIKTKTKIASIAPAPTVALSKPNPKFVRLPAVKPTQAKAQVDALRTIKDLARADILAGRTGSAYQRLRGQVAAGRSDIEFLGLLALASLQHHPDESQVLYHHLTELQPDAKRWQQGLAEAQRLLANWAVDAEPALANVNGSSDLMRVPG